MSSAKHFPELVDEEIVQWSQNEIATYLTLSSLALAIYDYLLTLPLEVTDIWNRRYNIMKLLFLLNRYSFILYIILTNFNGLLKPASDIECSVTSYTSNILLTIVTLSICGIFTLRTFAIYQKSYTVLVLLGCVSLALVGSMVWNSIDSASIALPDQLQVGPYRCIAPYSSPLDYLLNIISALIFDSLVLLLTVAKMTKSVIEARKLRVKNSISVTFLRDGAFYYCIIFIPEILELLMIILSTNIRNAALEYVPSDLGIMLDVLQWAMTNRLILNLCRTAADRDGYSQKSTLSNSIVFASASDPSSTAELGNFGAPLRAGLYGEDKR